MPLTPCFIAPARLETIRERYRLFPLLPISYATVRDYSDGAAQLPEIGTIARDLKDAQRPWMLKAIIGNTPPGGRLLEIGAGDPHVAHWLDLLGYEVTIVDPYDGSGHGPTDFEFYRRHFPRIKFIREHFSDHHAELKDATFDSIYSISVLEHIPHAALLKVMAGIRRYQKPAAKTIHAVDHVHKGNGSEYHRTTLKVIAEGLTLKDSDVSSALANAHNDPDTYLLSAESHNMWRGDLSYDEFPMRRCLSMQFAQTL